VEGMLQVEPAGPEQTNPGPEPMRTPEELLTESLLGNGHSLKCAALRYARLGFGGSGRE
jgi:hypothetical protein